VRGPSGGRPSFRTGEAGSGGISNRLCGKKRRRGELHTRTPQTNSETTSAAGDVGICEERRDGE